MAVVVEAFDGRILDGPVHSFDLAVLRENDSPDRFLVLRTPWMARSGQAVFDVEIGAGALEGVAANWRHLCKDDRVRCAIVGCSA